MRNGHPTDKEDSARTLALKAIINVPYFPADAGTPHRVCQFGVSREFPDGRCSAATKPGGGSYCAEHHAVFFFKPEKPERKAA